MNIFLASLLIVYGFSQIQGLPRVDGQCGIIAGTFFPCITNQCCSEYGWCGAGETYCNSKTQNPPIPPVDPPGTAVLTPISQAPKTDGSCGMFNQVFFPCTVNQCCSKYGWCGIGDAYCTNSQVPPVASTTTSSPGGPTVKYIEGSTYQSNTLKSFQKNARSECIPLCGAGCDFFVFDGATCYIKYLDRSSLTGTMFNGQLNSNYLFGKLFLAPLTIIKQAGALISTAECLKACTDTATCELAEMNFGLDGKIKSCTLSKFPKVAGSSIGYFVSPVSINNDEKKLGRFDVIGNGGVVGIHANLLPNGKLLYTARPESNRDGPNTDNISRPSVPNGEIAAIFDPILGTHVPNRINDNIFCHSMIQLADGGFFATGGDSAQIEEGLQNGLDKQRIFDYKTGNWRYLNNMSRPRWYPSMIRLVNGDIFIIGGTASFEFIPQNNLEIYRKDRRTNPVVALPVIEYTGSPYYPIVKLIPGSGNVFMVLADGYAILDRNTGEQLETNLPDSRWPQQYTGDYPTGAVVLGLNPDTDYKAELVLFGGSNGMPSEKAHDEVMRLHINSKAPQIPIYDNGRMPYGRIVSDAILQPSGKVLLFNGGSLGRTGGEIGFSLVKAEALDVFQYDPYAADGTRWKVLGRTPIRRLYHSSTVLLPDGRIAVQGTDQATYNLRGPAPYEHRVEAFTPPWLLDGTIRPVINSVPNVINYGKTFIVDVTGTYDKVSLMAPGASTHGSEMSQSLIFLKVVEKTGSRLTLVAPPNPTVAIQGYYMLFLVNKDTPSIAKWVKLA